LEGVAATVSFDDEVLEIGAAGAVEKAAAEKLEAFAKALRDMEEEAKEA
jgi:CRISPR-associated RAMP protein